MSSQLKLARAIVVFLLLGGSAQRADAALLLSGTATPGNSLAAGSFAGGTVLDITVAGAIDLVGGTGFTWRTFADGSLQVPVSFPAYSYANIGATNYPTSGGGDGINHFAGGGANFDTSPFAANGPYGFAGAQTTDTLAPGVIRFGAVVGTWAVAPTRSDWFLVGLGTTITAPTGGGTLYLAVNDGSNANNVGSYSVEIQAHPVPEPASGVLFALGGLLLLGRQARRKHRLQHG